MASGFSERAFERAYSLCFPGFLDWAQRANGVDRDTAEDLVCQARLAAFHLRDRYDPARCWHSGLPASFQHWAGRILVLICRSYRRNNGHQSCTVPMEAVEEMHAPMRCEGLGLSLQIALDELPPYLRDVVDLHLNGESLADISQILGIHRNTASNRLEEIGQRLRVKLPGFEPEVDDRLISYCSEVAVYVRPARVWDRQGSAEEIQQRRRHIRVTNGFTESPNGRSWFDRAGRTLTEEYARKREVEKQAQVARLPGDVTKGYVS